MNAERPHWMTATEAGAALRAGEISVRELTEDALAWIEESDTVTRSWVTVTPEIALAEADAADRELAAGIDRGPLHGIGYGVKDLIEVAGVEMAVGSRAVAGFVPRGDAAAVGRLRDAGAICLGKTVTHEFAFGSTSPPARNPWDGVSVPGGSSGGSAAVVAAGQAPLAVGTDCCCSVRNPAALNGICGIRPTVGRVSNSGAVPASLSMDTVGPLCRSVRDVALALTAMSAYDATDPRSSSTAVPDFAAELDRAPGDLDGVRVGIPESHFFDHLEPDIAARLDLTIDLLEDLGAEVRAVDIPRARHASTIFFVIVVAEQAALQHDQLRDPERPRLGDDVQAWAEFGNLVLAKDYVRAQQMRELVITDWARAFESVDAILTPATAAVAKPPLEDPVRIEVGYPDGYVEDVLQAYGRFLMPVSLAGLPGLVVPCGRDAKGLPIGAQVVAPAFRESTAFRVGEALERALDLPPVRPPAVSAVAAGPVLDNDPTPPAQVRR